MKKKQRRTQLVLVFIGICLFVTTYLLYPDVNKNELSKDRSSANYLEETATDENKHTTFESLEYKGIYNLDKPFIVKSKKAYILNENPNLVYMKSMHVTLHLSDGRIVNIISDKGKYNKKTYDCYFEQNVKATDGSTKIFAENLDLLAAKNYVEIYNNVILDNISSNLQADKINYNFETKYFKISMFDDKAIKMKVIQ